MKKTLLSVFVFLFCASFAQAQVCTPDPMAVAMGLPGLYPNPVTDSLYDGYVGVPYNQTITIIVPADTSITVPIAGQVTAQIVKQTIVSIDSLPPGVTSVCNVTSCVWTGGANGCVKLSGTPTMPGVYNVKVNLTTQATFQSLPVNIPAYTVPYTITISYAQDIEDQLDANYFRFAPCVPNPATENTTLSFSSPNSAAITATVYDLTGRLVKSESFRCESGINAYNLNLKGLNSGIYLVTLSNGKMTLNQKMAVK